MTHNPLCGTVVPEKAMTDQEMLNQTSDRHSRAGYAMTHDRFCWDDPCECSRIRLVREDMLSKCIAEIKQMACKCVHMDTGGVWRCDRCRNIESLRNLQEKE